MPKAPITWSGGPCRGHDGLHWSSSENCRGAAICRGNSAKPQAKTGDAQIAGAPFTGSAGICAGFRGRAIRTRYGWPDLTSNAPPSTRISPPAHLPRRLPSTRADAAISPDSPANFGICPQPRWSTRRARPGVLSGACHRTACKQHPPPPTTPGRRFAPGQGNLRRVVSPDGPRAGRRATARAVATQPHRLARPDCPRPGAKARETAVPWVQGPAA